MADVSVVTLGANITMHSPEHGSEMPPGTTFAVAGSFNPSGLTPLNARVFRDEACQIPWTNLLTADSDMGILQGSRQFSFLSNIWLWAPPLPEDEDVAWIRIKTSASGISHKVKIKFVAG